MCFPLNWVKKKKSYLLSYRPKMHGSRFLSKSVTEFVPSYKVTRLGTHSLFRDTYRWTGKWFAHMGLRNAVGNIHREGIQQLAFPLASPWRNAHGSSAFEKYWTWFPCLCHVPKACYPSSWPKPDMDSIRPQHLAHWLHRARLHRSMWPADANRSCKICKACEVQRRFHICPTTLLILLIYQDRLNVITRYFYSKSMINSKNTATYYFTKSSVK